MELHATISFYPGVSKRQIREATIPLIASSDPNVEVSVPLSSLHDNWVMMLRYGRYDNNWEAFESKINEYAENLDGLCAPVAFEVYNADQYGCTPDKVDEEGTWTRWVGGRNEADRILGRKQDALEKAITAVGNILKKADMSHQEINECVTGLLIQEEEVGRYLDRQFFDFQQHDGGDRSECEQAPNHSAPRARE